MEQLDYGEEIPCSSNLDNAALGPDDSKTVDAPMLVLYPAKENNWSEHKDVVAGLFIVGLFIVYTWANTIPFIGATIAFKHIRDDVSSTDDDMSDVSQGYTFHHNASTSAAGSGSVTLALSVGTMAASDEPGNIQLLLVCCGCIRMHYYM